MNAPAYLQPPPAPAATPYGTVDHDAGTNDFVVRAHPVALELAKRLFPGAAAASKDALRFKATRRALGDLNLLLMRYPMDLRCRDLYEQIRVEAVDHAVRREENRIAGPVQPPATFIGKLIEPYQPAGVGFLTRSRRCLLADDMGTGKTIQAIAAMATADRWPVLVVCPPSLVVQWMRQVGVFLRSPRVIYRDDVTNGRNLCRVLRGNTPKPMPPRPVTICHYLQLKHWREWILREGPPKVVVFDEMQELRHPVTDKYSAASLIAQEAEYVWGLSGTPIYNYGSEIWSITNILDFNCLGSQESFTREWCTGYAEKVVRDPVALGDHLRTEGLMLRRTKAEVQSSLPPKRRVVTAIEKDDDLYRRWIAKAVDIAKRYDTIREFTAKGQARREIDQIARQATGIAKAPHVAAFVETLVEAGEKVLVYAHHHAVHTRIGEILAKRGPVLITGQQTQGQKDAAVRAFGQGATSVVQLSLRGAAGIDGLQGQGTCVVFAELDWSPAVHAQCEDRIHRIGFEGRESLLCYYLVSDAGCDEVMQEALGLKVGQFVALMGDKGESQAEREEAQRQGEKHIERIIDRLRRL